jgi:hypothetical protein
LTVACGSDARLTEPNDKDLDGLADDSMQSESNTDVETPEGEPPPATEVAFTPGQSCRGSGFDTGLDEEQLLNQIDDEDFAQVCDAIRTLGGTQRWTTYACNVYAISVAASYAAGQSDFEADCGQLRVQCLQQYQPDSSTVDCGPRFVIPQSCTATVCDYEACTDFRVSGMPLNCEMSVWDAQAFVQGTIDQNMLFADSPECLRLMDVACTGSAGQ